ncbi:MAG: DUF739 domain-containing protein [Clostridiales bacterium]|nr:DUF739 domain-containing protein [Clostridiales bacterium]
MLDKKALKAAIVKNGYTQEYVAKKIGMSSRTFSNKIKKGVFGSDEIEKMTLLLQLDKPWEIFFFRK